MTEKNSLGIANTTLLNGLIKLDNRAVRSVRKIHINEQIITKDVHFVSTNILQIKNMCNAALSNIIFIAL